MARPVWSGTLSFGLVALPMQLYAATETHTIRFHQLQRGTSDRVRNKRVNERTGDEVPSEEIVKGYDMGDEYVVVEPDELAEIAPGRSRAMEISGFVDADSLDPVTFDRAYYLGPKDPGYAKVYALLHRALTESGKAGIATVVMRNREYLVAVVPEGDVLALHTLHWWDEVRDPHREIGGLPEGPEVAEKELRTAVQLVDALSMEWHPEEYRDTYQERVLELVEAKRTGRSVEKGEPPPRSTNVVDLMDALEASVQRARSGRGEDGGGSTEEEKEKPARGQRGRGAPADLAERRRARTAKKAGDPAELTKAQLYRRATEAGIPGRSSMTRDELLDALQQRGGGAARAS